MKLTVQGRAAHVYTGGKPFDASLPCVVFVHGALHDHSVWTLLARWCAHHGQGVLAVDLPGHGQSAGPVAPDVPALADWLLALLAAAGVQRAGQATVVGHSMGSLIALEAAARAAPLAADATAPEAATPGGIGVIGRLVLVGTAFPMQVSPALLGTAAEQPLQAIEMVNGFSIASMASKPSFPGPGMWLHGSNRALMRRTLRGPNASGCAVNLFHHDFSVCDRYTGGLQAAQAARARGVRSTLVLGSADQMTPARAARPLAEALGARIVLLPCGHSLPAEAPEGVLEALRSALA